MKLKKQIGIMSIISILILAIILPCQPLNVDAAFESFVQAKANLLMDAKTGKVLVENNAYEHLPIASVTKLMTILITLEEIDQGHISTEEKIIVSENASGMGGSQIFLNANQEYEIGQLLKSVIVCSANDSSVALAEHIAGSEQNFVKLMNEKAQVLGLNNTNYSNCTGLPSSEGYSCAHDQAIVLKIVLSYDLYHDYSSIWMEDFTHPSGRITQMTNTNKLSRFYDGCIGGKTGSTNQAKYCLAVGAERNNSQFISVVLGAENSKNRFALASELLNYGFANYSNETIFSNDNLADKFIKIKGTDHTIQLKVEREYSLVKEKNTPINFSINYHLPNTLNSVKENDIVGSAEIIVDGVVVDTINILSCSTYSEPTVWEYFKEIIN